MKKELDKCKEQALVAMSLSLAALMAFLWRSR
jgi:hypothetical protein